jgi:outer membrane immunogenic protein
MHKASLEYLNTNIDEGNHYMKKVLQLSVLSAALLSLPLLMITSSASAAGMRSDLDRAYDDGYDDGYEDCMDDCKRAVGLRLLAGWYFGMGLGYEGFQMYQRPRILNDGFGTLNTHANGWTGRLFGGYGYTHNNYYLGGELSAGNSWASGSNSLNAPGLNYNGSISAEKSYGLSILPGYKLFGDSGPLTYGRLGAVTTEFDINDRSAVSGNKSTQWSSGANIGVGVEMPLMKTFSARLEYDYYKYSSVDNNGATGSHTSPSDNRGELDIIYHLGRF